MDRELDERAHYRQAGVDIAGEAAVERIRAGPLHFPPRSASGLGRFSGFLRLKRKDTAGRYWYPAATVWDEVENSLLPRNHTTVGEDCWPCALTTSWFKAQSPFFLDYLAVGKLDPEQVEQVVRGLASGCRIAGCALWGRDCGDARILHSRE